MSGAADGASRVAVVTGAAYGIGRSIAERLAAEGYRLALTAERDLSETAGNLTARGVQSVLTRTIDLSAEPASISDFIDEVEGRFGGIDVLVNNAGITLQRPLAEITEDDVRRLTHVNAWAAFFGCQAAARQMTAHGGGAIINVSSVLAGLALQDHALYAATKGWIESLTRQLAFDLAAPEFREGFANRMRRACRHSRDRDCARLVAWSDTRGETAGTRTAHVAADARLEETCVLRRTIGAGPAGSCSSPVC